MGLCRYDEDYRPLNNKIILDYPGGLDLIRAVLKTELSLVGSRRDMQHKRH